MIADLVRHLWLPPKPTLLRSSISWSAKWPTNYLPTVILFEITRSLGQRPNASANADSIRYCIGHFVLIPSLAGVSNAVFNSV